MEFDFFLIMLSIIIISFFLILNLLYSFILLSKNLKKQGLILIEAEMYFADLAYLIASQKGLDEFNQKFLPLIQELRQSLKQSEQASYLKYQELNELLKIEFMQDKNYKKYEFEFNTLNIRIPQFVHNYNSEILVFQSKSKNPIFSLFNKYILRIDSNYYNLISY